MDTKEFDIYKLSDFNEGKGSIKAVINPTLEINTIEALEEIKSKGTLSCFCKEIGISYITLWGYIKKSRRIPLFVLKELEFKTKKPLHQHIDNLVYGAGSTQRFSLPVKNLTKNLSKFIGAFAADGHLKQRTIERNGRKLIHYELIFREEFLSNMQSLSAWINDTFGINVVPKKEKNHYYIYISNKIVFRYFNKIFGFNSGRKTETIRAPDFIKSSNEGIKASFIEGVLMFDGYVNKNNGYIELYSKSKNLIEDVYQMSSELGIKPDYISQKPDKFGRHRLIIRRQEKLRKCLIFFETGTEKNQRLNNCIKKFRRINNGGLEMAKDKTEEIMELMKNPEKIRNIAIAAHID